MRAVFDYSWHSLTEREREVFQALSVFRGGFTRQAAQEVAGASLRKLRALVNKSLLQRDLAGRYGIHELLRQYAAEQLGASGETEAVRDAHCAYYAKFLRQREAHLLGRGQKQALAEIGAEVENVRAGWDWAVAQGRIEDIDRSLESLAEFYRLRSWFQEGEESFARAAHKLAEVQEETGDRKARLVLGKVLLQQGRFCDPLGLAEKGSELLQTSLAISRDLGARREMAYALYHLAGIALVQADEKPYCQEGLVIFKALGDQRGIALSLSGLGWLATIQGEYKAAKELYQESRTIFKELGNLEGLADSLLNLGYTAWMLGEYEEAKKLHRESLALHQELGDQKGIADSLDHLARDTSGSGEYEEAKRLFQESLGVFKEIGHPFGIAWVLGNSGEVANVRGEHAEAIQLAQDSLELFKEIGHPFGMAWSYRVLGNAACGLGDLGGARKYFGQALETAVIVRWTPVTLLALVGVGALLGAEGEREKALELLALGLHHPLSWQWVKDRAAPLIAELEAELPLDVAAAARERGRTHDLGATVAELLDELGGTGTNSLDHPAPSPEGIP